MNQQEKLKELAKELGKAIGMAQISCPNCLNNKQEQPLCSTGDDEYHIFCPHCTLEFDITAHSIDSVW